MERQKVVKRKTERDRKKEKRDRKRQKHIELKTERDRKR
jgi:hypothetical protein